MPQALTYQIQRAFLQKKKLFSYSKERILNIKNDVIVPILTRLSDPMALFIPAYTLGFDIFAH
jgi:hypothetical protein